MNIIVIVKLNLPTGLDGKNLQKYKLTGAHVKSHKEHDDIGYSYGDITNGAYDLGDHVEYDEFIWHYIGPDGTAGEVEDNNAKNEIGLPDDYFVSYVFDWFDNNIDKIFEYDDI